MFGGDKFSSEKDDVFAFKTEAGAKLGGLAPQFIRCGEVSGVHAMWHVEELLLRNAEDTEVVAIGFAYAGECGELPIEKRKRESPKRGGIAPADEMGITAKNQRKPVESCPQDQFEVGDVVVAEEQDGVRTPSGDSRR